MPHCYCNCGVNPLSTYPSQTITQWLRGKEPTGHFTGRCSECGSKNLWDDAGTLAYGCRDFGAILHTSG